MLHSVFRTLKGTKDSGCYERGRICPIQKKNTTKMLPDMNGYTGGVPEQYQNPSQYGTGTNWYDLLTRNAATQNYSISCDSQ